MWMLVVMFTLGSSAYYGVIDSFPTQADCEAIKSKSHLDADEFPPGATDIVLGCIHHVPHHRDDNGKDI